MNRIFLQKIYSGAFLIAIMLLGVACEQVALFERTKNIEGGAWQSTQIPEYNLDITDTTKAYQVFVVLRHTNQYPYRNIWLNVGLQLPGDSLKEQRFELPLASAEKWLGQGMDDVYEHQAPLFPYPVRFNRAGQVRLTLQQIMRQNPLPGVLQAGIRIEPIANP